MASKSPTVCVKLCAIMCMAMLFSSRVAAQRPGLIPRLPTFPAAGPSSQQVDQCWSPLAIIPGCVREIYGALLRGQFIAIGSACCKAITEVQTKCWQIIFPLNPHFLALLNSTCDQSGGRKLAMRKVVLPGLSSTDLGSDARQCLSSFTSIPGCLPEIYGSLVSGNFRVIGPACCKAITKITGSCWSRLFPFNPYFPTLLKSSCGGSAGNGNVNVNVPSLPFVEFTFPGTGLLPPGPAKCWRSLASISGCVLEIYGAISRGQFGSIGPACCKVVTGVSNGCWTQMFPMNPLFPLLLTSSCARSRPPAALAPHPPSD